MAWKKWEVWVPTAASTAKGLAFDPLVTTLVPDPTDVPELFVMQGLLGPSPTPNVWRLYRNHAMNEYYDIDEKYVHHCEPLPAEGVRVWVLRGSPMAHVVQQARPAEVDYLSGPIADQAARRAAVAAPIDGPGGPEPTACPKCPSQSP